MAQNYGGLRVVAPATSALYVSITNTASGLVPGVWSDAALTTAVTPPLVVAAGATGNFYFATPGLLTLSVKTVGGQEIADTLGQQPLKVEVSPGVFGVYDFSLLKVPAVTGQVANRAMDGWNPALNGFLAGVGDPEQLNSANTIGPGVPTLIAIPLDTAITVSTFWYSFTTTSTSPTSSQNFVGLYGNRSGNTVNLLGVSADQTTNFGSSNVNRSAALTVQSGQSLTLPAGSTVYAAFLFNGTTSPSFLRVGAQSTAGNINLTAPALRSMVVGSGATTLPATLDISTGTIVSPFWAALS